MIEERSEVGGGSLPGVQIPTAAVVLHTEEMSADQVAEWLRGCHPPIIGRIVGDMCILDLRTIQDDEVPIVVKSIGERLKLGGK